MTWWFIFSDGQHESNTGISRFDLNSSDLASDVSGGGGDIVGGGISGGGGGASGGGGDTCGGGGDTSGGETSQLL